MRIVLSSGRGAARRSIPPAREGRRRRHEFKRDWREKGLVGAPCGAWRRPSSLFAPFGRLCRRAVVQSVAAALLLPFSLPSNPLIPSGNQDKNRWDECLKADQASHFILRLAYCRSENLRRWFLTNEAALFKHRLEELEKRGQLGTFMKHSKVQLEKLEKAEVRALQGFLGFNLSIKEVEAGSFCKIPFAEATDLVARREVFLMDGYAYVPTSKLVSILACRFRSNLSRSMSLASASFAKVGEEGRVGALLKDMNKQYTGKSFGEGQGLSTGEINADNVDEYAETRMPLCMKMIHKGLKKDHKLKHDGRRQYGLFLKAAGMSMEDSLLFFQKEFTKIMTADEFNKQYTYNIRHSYGKEGKRQNYTAFTSTTIIMGPRRNPSEIGSHHGCPFAHYSESSLSSLLSSMSITGPSKEKILTHSRNRMPQLACAEHFAASHPGAELMSREGVNMEGVGNHPNAWFMASTMYHKAKNPGKGAGGNDQKQHAFGKSKMAEQGNRNAAVVSPVGK